jgi:hypothetical protein
VSIPRITELPTGIAPAGAVVAAARLGAPAGIDEAAMLAAGQELGTPWLLPPRSMGGAYGARLDRDTDQQVIRDALFIMPGQEAAGWKLILVPAPLIPAGLQYARVAAGGAGLGESIAGVGGSLAGGVRDVLGGASDAVAGVGTTIGLAPWIVGAAAVLALGLIVLGLIREVRK